MTEILPLRYRDGHVFVELAGEAWLLDTGAPESFGASRGLTIAGQAFEPGESYLGLDAAGLSELTGTPCAGLLGADVLGCFDHVFDLDAGRLEVSKSELALRGRNVALEEFMGIPIVTARIGQGEHRMFFDTGAQYSYFQGDALDEHPDAGAVEDFYPGLGRFRTETRRVPLSLGGATLELRCGRLPELIGLTLMMASVDGIVGNAVLHGRSVGYFPRRRRMSMGEEARA
ncbi:MAG TPA: hypothetical protein PKC23_04230 [Candidatus Desulfobacillus sp.]|nr:hypothetical protein [Candidatus Desulfobacillus sp.]